MEILEVGARFVKELHVCDLIGRSVQADEIGQVGHLGNVFQLVLAHIDTLQVHKWSQDNAKLLDLLLLLRGLL